MNKLKIGLSVLAVLIGAGSVLASNAATANSNSVLQTYTWQHYDRQGNPIGSPVPNLTELQAENMFDCHNTTSTKCAQTVPDPSLTIYYSN